MMASQSHVGSRWIRQGFRRPKEIWARWLALAIFIVLGDHEMDECKFYSKWR